jgi:predicted transcriptional regulator
MATIKISSRVEEQVWEELRLLAQESNQSLSDLLTEAISDYLQRRRVRPDVLEHLSDSMTENDDLGKLLAR